MPATLGNLLFDKRGQRGRTCVQIAGTLPVIEIDYDFFERDTSS